MHEFEEGSIERGAEKHTNKHADTVGRQSCDYGSKDEHCTASPRHRQVSRCCTHGELAGHNVGRNGQNNHAGGDAYDNLQGGDVR